MGRRPAALTSFGVALLGERGGAGLGECIEETGKSLGFSTVGGCSPCELTSTARGARSNRSSRNVSVWKTSTS
jgi:hypothetical protein